MKNGISYSLAFIVFQKKDNKKGQCIFKGWQVECGLECVSIAISALWYGQYFRVSEYFCFTSCAVHY